VSHHALGLSTLPAVTQPPGPRSTATASQGAMVSHREWTPPLRPILASPAASYTTGAAFAVDGGYLA